MADLQDAPTLANTPVGGMENVIVGRLRDKLERANRIRKFADFEKVKELGEVRQKAARASAAASSRGRFRA